MSDATPDHPSSAPLAALRASVLALPSYDGPLLWSMVKEMVDELGDKVDIASVLDAAQEPGDEVAIIASHFARHVASLADTFVDERKALLEIDARVQRLAALEERLIHVFAGAAWRRGEHLTVAQTAVLHVQIKPSTVRKWVERGVFAASAETGQTRIDPSGFNLTYEMEDARARLLASHAQLTPDERVDRKYALKAYMAQPRS